MHFTQNTYDTLASRGYTNFFFIRAIDIKTKKKYINSIET